jgi:MaoC like domain
MLALRKFEPADQLRFARLTGDTNPIHTDAIFARRTFAGAPVVHGIHALLWLLDCIAAGHAELPALSRIKARFARAIYVGESAQAEIRQLSSKTLRAEVTVDGSVAIQLVATFGPSDAPIARARIASSDPVPSAPINRPIDDMAGRSGELSFFSRLDDYQVIFPNAVRIFGLPRVAALCCSSFLVGMIVPGLHSLYSALDVRLCADGDPAEPLQYEVKSVHPIFRLVDIDIWGAGLSGSLQAFARHPPMVQSSMQAVAPLVRASEFSRARVLIIGGSRGLGALTANIVAAGGGKVTISYAAGKLEAEALANDIQAAGGHCDVLPFDIHRNADKQLADLSEPPTHIYYFPTPPIFMPKSNLFDRSRFESFNTFYLYGFNQMVEAVARRTPEQTRIFYPSSVAVHDRPANMTEYAMSKMAGEILCQDINANFSNVHVVIGRLPRLPTDQTFSFQPVETADPVATMLPLIRHVQGNDNASIV